MSDLKANILDLSRQSRIAPLSPWFEQQLDAQIERGTYLPIAKVQDVGEQIVQDLGLYRAQTSVRTVVLGMSGGVDSALTAALFKAAGWRVIGLTLPIHQNADETERGIEACAALGIEHIHKDLSGLYDAALVDMADVDPGLVNDSTDRATNTRRGNVRARLRMITLYNLAARHAGVVASTDNYSELCAGFWTLHGDVGDLAPIQSLLKSWDVPALARVSGVPEKTWRATPTDGLAILQGGDEAQLGCTYLEWDLMVNAIQHAMVTHPSDLDALVGGALVRGERAKEVLGLVFRRMRGNWYKRMSPVMLRHAFEKRYDQLEAMDSRLFRPPVVTR